MIERIPLWRIWDENNVRNFWRLHSSASGVAVPTRVMWNLPDEVRREVPDVFAHHLQAAEGTQTAISALVFRSAALANLTQEITQWLQSHASPIFWLQVRNYRDFGLNGAVPIQVESGRDLWGLMKLGELEQGSQRLKRIEIRRYGEGGPPGMLGLMQFDIFFSPMTSGQATHIEQMTLMTQPNATNFDPGEE